MTVSTVVDHNDYTGNGITTSFPYTFRIFKKTDLTVSVIDLSENITVLVLDTDYTVTNAGGYEGGSVVLTTPLANGWKISIARELEPTQETDLRNQGKFFAEVHEDAFDKLTMLIQQCLYKIGLTDRRAIKVPEQGNWVAPAVANRKNKIFAWDNSGSPIAVLPQSGSASDVLIELAKPTGAGLSGTTSGNTVQEELDNISQGITQSRFRNVLDWFPEANREAINNLNKSKALGSVSDYIELALNELFPSGIGRSYELWFPAGFYWLDRTLKLPSKAIIKGVYPNSYLMALPNFTGNPVDEHPTNIPIIQYDNPGQDPFIVEGFQINSDSSQDGVVGIHIGGSRNSTVQNVSISGCYGAPIYVYPTNHDSGDVENLNLRNVWTLGGATTIRSNKNISRGNITDMEIRDCMLFGHIPAYKKGKSPYALLVKCEDGKQVYGLNVARTYTSTQNNTFIYMQNVNGVMRDITFEKISGESQDENGQLLLNLTEEHMHIDGLTNSRFVDMFRSGGIIGKGIVLTNCSDNIFDGVSFGEVRHIDRSYNSQWVQMTNTCYGNIFTNSHYNNSFMAGSSMEEVSVNRYFGYKIIDNGYNNRFDDIISSRPGVIYSQQWLFGNNGANIPQGGGITMQTQADGSLKVVFPPSSNTISFNIPIPGGTWRAVGVVAVYTFTSMDDNATLRIALNNKYHPLEYRSSGEYNASILENVYNPTSWLFVVGGSRVKSVEVIFKSLIITPNCIPYLFNNVRTQVII